MIGSSQDGATAAFDFPGGPTRQRLLRSERSGRCDSEPARRAKGWDDLCQHAPTNARKAWDPLRLDPRPAEDPRHTRLHGEAGTKMRGGRTMEVWQIEVTAGGRIFYAIDDECRTVWLEVASPGHPKKTEKKR